MFEVSVTMVIPECDSNRWVGLRGHLMRAEGVVLSFTLRLHMLKRARSGIILFRKFIILSVNGQSYW